MKTKIYQTREAFYARENKAENGVSPQFAESMKDWEKQNENNEGCYDCYDCSRCSDCSDCSDCSGCSGCYACCDCSDCSRCSRCSGCYDCYDCYDCSRCSDCSDCYDCENKKDESSDAIKIPIVEGVHSKVLAEVSKEGAFDMSNWHKSKTEGFSNGQRTECGMTHCRGGWVITLAGKAGSKLEKQTSSEFAAMAIYNASSHIKVSPVRFYESNKVAMADMVRCAKEESENSKSSSKEK